MKYETCYNCNGHGLVTGDNGDPALCKTCRGNTVIPARDKKGRFIK